MCPVYFGQVYPAGKTVAIGLWLIVEREAGHGSMLHLQLLNAIFESMEFVVPTSMNPCDRLSSFCVCQMFQHRHQRRLPDTATDKDMGQCIFDQVERTSGRCQLQLFSNLKILMQ